MAVETREGDWIVRLVVSGTRDLERAGSCLSRAFWEFGIGSPWVGSDDGIDLIIHGGSGNVDIAARDLGTRCGIRVAEFTADWANLGRSAGPIRNKEMAEVGTHLLAVWDGESRGTKNMINEALNAGLHVMVYQVNKKQRPLKWEDDLSSQMEEERDD